MRQSTFDSTQEWFWMPKWQAGEAASSSDIAAGRVEVFDGEEEFLEALAE